MMRRPPAPGGKPASPSSDPPRRALHLLVALNLTALLAFWASTRTLASSAAVAAGGGGGGGAVVLAGGRRAAAGAAKPAAVDAALAVTTAGMRAEGISVSPLPPRPVWKGGLDVDAAVATRAAELKAAGVGGAPGAARGKRGYFLSYVETDPLYPFQRIRFADGSDTGVVAVIAPFYDLNYFRAATQRALFWRLKAAGHIVLGVSSYQEFPGDISNPHDDRHVTPGDRAMLRHVDGWLHCFRPAVAAAVLPPGVPRMLLSESDFTDAERRDGGGSLVPWGPPTVVKKYDLAYSDQGGAWNDYARNWTLAVACIARLARDRNATTLVLGRDPAEAPELKPWVDKGLVVKAPAKLPWRDFLKEVEASHIMFAPNTHDASPRVVAEALSLDVAVLINANIDGGWKYAQPATGALFTSPDDVVAAYDTVKSRLAAGELTPRRWFKENSGQANAAIALEAFLQVTQGQARLDAAAAVGKRVT